MNAHLGLMSDGNHHLGLMSDGNVHGSVILNLQKPLGEGWAAMSECTGTGGSIRFYIFIKKRA